VLPDGPLIAALLGAAVCLVAAMPTSGRAAWGWWLGTGLWAGVALFSKYSAALTIAGAIVFLLTEPAGRRWLRRPHPYAAGLLALTVFSPRAGLAACHWAVPWIAPARQPLLRGPLDDLDALKRDALRSAGSGGQRT
jgi:4-amino-4-deoxy-L-arabinose transferase-like glycosyltransferase